MPPAALACLCLSDSPWGGVVLFLACLPRLWFDLLPPLPRRGRISPRPPSPAGKGENQSYFMQGASPLASPGLNPSGTYSPSKNRYPAGCAPGGTYYPCPGGEDHLKRRRRLRRIVPSPPVPPLLGWRRCSPVPRPNRQGFESPCTAVITKGTRFPQEKPMPLPAQPRGCKGRSPLHKITLKLPLPRRGRGAGG